MLMFVVECVAFWTQNQGGKKRKGSYFFQRNEVSCLGNYVFKGPRIMILRVWWRGLNTQPKIMTLNREQPAGGGGWGGCEVWSHLHTHPRRGKVGARRT